MSTVFGDRSDRPRRGQHKTFLLLLFLTTLWQALANIHPRFTPTDEIAFKAAGRQWARDGRFAAPELIGFRQLEPPAETVWFGQMPVYTFGFGLVVKLLGFGVYQSQLYDATIHGILCLVTFWIARTLAPKAPPWSACLAGILLLPLAAPGRADELAAVIGSCSILLLHGSRSSSLRHAVAGVLAGLTSATSPAAAVLLPLIAVCTLVARKAPVVREPGLWITFLGGALLGFATGLLPPLLQDHNSWRQMLRHGSEEIGHELSWGLAFSWRFGKPQILGIASGLVIGVAAALRGMVSPVHRDWGNWTSRWLGPVLALALTALVFPAKYYYAAFLLPWVLGAATPGAWELARQRRVLVLVVAGSCYCLAILRFLAFQVILWSLPRSQTLSYNVSRIRELVPVASSVYAQEYWSSLGDTVKFISMVHGNPDAGRIDYVLLTANGTGAPGKPVEIPHQQYFDSQFFTIYDNLPRERIRVLGIPISHSAWGFGVRILGRRSFGKEGRATPHLRNADHERL